MRIIGYLEHPTLKITVFKMDDKLSVKFENGYFEQTVKIRSFEGLSTLEEINHLVDQQYLGDVEDLFRQMDKVRQAAFQRFLPPSVKESFEEII